MQNHILHTLYRKLNFNYLLSILVFSLLFTTVKSNQIDSLQKLIKKETNDTLRVNHKIALAHIYADNSDYGRSIDMLQNSLGEAKKINYATGIIDTYYTIGEIESEQGNYKNAFDAYFNALNFAEKINNADKIATVQNAIGILYWYQNDLENALLYYNKAFAICKTLKNSSITSGILNNIGLIYRKQGNYQKALDYYMQAVDLCKQQNNIGGMADAVNNMGIVFQFQKKYKEALQYYEQSLKLREQIHDQIGIATSLGNIGDLLAEQGQIDKAIVYYEKSLSTSIQAKDFEGIALTSISLSTIYENRNDGNKALYYYKKYVDSKEKIQLAEAKKEAYKLELNHQYEQNKLKIEKERETQKIANAAEKKKQTILLLSVLIGLFIVTVFSFFLYKRYKISQKQNKIIELQKKIVEEKNKDILDSIHYAKQIQNALISPSHEWNSHISEHFVFFKPKDVVSGDFYWSAKRFDEQIKSNQTLFIAVCDSTGHGVPGAFMSLLNISYLNEAVNEKNIAQPNQIFNHVRQQLIAHISAEGAKDGMDGILGKFSLQNNSIQFTYAAAHNNPVLVRNKKLIELECDKINIGLSDKISPFNQYEFDLVKGDMLYLYTDGFADQFGIDSNQIAKKPRKFKYANLNQLLVEIADKSCAQQNEILLQAFNQWKGKLEQTDDVCLIGLKI